MTMRRRRKRRRRRRIVSCHADTPHISIPNTSRLTTACLID
jgi:ribosomal protein L18